MLYSEFVKGTQCRDTEHNYRIYKDLEVMYMNSNLTKAEIYEYGKKLVDNSKPKEQIEFEETLLAEKKRLNQEIDRNRLEKKKSEESMSYWKQEKDKFMVYYLKSDINYRKKEIARLRNEIRGINFVLEA